MLLEVPIVHIRTAIAYMVQEGLSEQALLSLMSLSREQLHEVDRVVSVKEYEALFKYGANHLNYADIGFRVGKWRDNGRWSLVGHIMNCCENVTQLVKVLKRYEILSGNIATHIFSQEDNRVSLRRISHYTCSYHVAEEVLARWVAFLSNSLIKDTEYAKSTLTSVHFTHSCQGNIKSYEDFFQSPVKFDSQYTGINFDSKLLASPLMGYNPELLKLLMGYADMIIDKKQKGADNDVLTGFILKKLPQKVPTIVEVAQHLGISQRTLQRKINERGSTFKKLIEDVRKEYAFIYLLQSNYKLSYIAQVLGYSEQSVFQRAFKRWTGLTPGEYRHQHGLK